MRRRITPPRICCVKTDNDKNTPGAEQLRESFYVGERTAVPGAVLPERTGYR